MNIPNHNQSKKARVRRVVVLSGTFALLACLSAFGYSRTLDRQTVGANEASAISPNAAPAPSDGKSERKSAPTLDLAKALPGADVNDERTSVYPGRVAAFKKSTLTFRVSGPLLEICVAPGQKIKKGEKLMQIDPRDYRIKVDAAQAQLDVAKANLDAMRNGARPEDVALLQTQAKQAEASLELAKKEYERSKQLVEKNAVSMSEYDLANKTYVLAGLAYESAKKELEKGIAGARVEEIAAAEAEIRGLESALESAKNSLEDTTLRAPYDGEVAAKLIEVDEMVTTTPTYREVLVVHDVSKLKIEVYVPERAMIDGSLDIGKKIDVRFTARRANLYQAELAEIDTEPSQVGMTYKLTFVLDAPKDLRALPGMICEALIPESTEE